MGLGKTYSTSYLADSNNNTGAEGQVLISTATGINWSDGADIIDGPYLPLAGGTIDGTLIIDTDTGAQPFYVTRNGGLDQALKIYVDDAAAIFESIQDETASGYGSFIFNMDAGVTQPFYDIRKNNSTILRVDGSGNVGIGTTSPSRKLSVEGSSSSIIADFKYSAAGYSSIDLSNNVSFARLSSVNSDLLLSPAGTERMRITSGGNVGIGTTLPFEKLDVVGKIYAQDRVISANVSLPNENLLPEASIKFAGQNDIYNNSTKTVISPYEARWVNDNTGGTTIRATTATLVSGEVYTVSIYYKDLIGSIYMDLGDTSITGSYSSATGTSAIPTSGRIYGYAVRNANNYEFIDINLSQAGSVTLLNIKLEQGKVVTEFIATPETQAIPQTITTNNLRATGSIQMGADDTTATADKVGTQRYRISGNNSYVDMCMQTGAATYEWVNIVQNNW